MKRNPFPPSARGELVNFDGRLVLRNPHGGQNARSGDVWVSTFPGEGKPAKGYLVNAGEGWEFAEVGFPNIRLRAKTKVGVEKELREAGWRRSKTKNPAGVRIVYNKLLGGWYVVTGPHQTPLNGRFDSKAEAEAWLGRRQSGSRNPGQKPLAWYISSAGARGPHAGKVGLWLLPADRSERRQRANNFGYFDTVQGATAQAHRVSPDTPVRMFSRNPDQACSGCGGLIPPANPGTYTCGSCGAAVVVG